MLPEVIYRYLEFYRDLKVPFFIKKASLAAAQPVAPTTEASTRTQPSETKILASGGAAPKHARLSSRQEFRPTLPPPPPPEASSGLFQAPDFPPNDSLEKIREDIGDCTRCRLHQSRTNIVFGEGNPKAKIVFVGEGPGAEEDLQGRPFVGRAGQLLTQMIEKTAEREGIPLKRSDVYICNVVKCRPPNNRTPLPDEIETCSQFLFRQLMVIRPKAICALGSTAARALLGTREGVTKLRGKWYYWRDIPVMVTYHPSYLLRPYNADAKRQAWEDLRNLYYYVFRTGDEQAASSASKTR